MNEQQRQCQYIGVIVFKVRHLNSLSHDQNKRRRRDTASIKRYPGFKSNVVDPRISSSRSPKDDTMVVTARWLAQVSTTDESTIMMNDDNSREVTFPPRNSTSP
ncbi:hypothetical protein SMKI_05G1170 [Saccharomyces mikatae IFO 1815]|uniref:Uncharacterized protein n=1 Tax=Saccharomyces mikatae IFO 1815 TaxID=226126 RepID=A0AA35NHB4_SACMI|nr:uncharacterized protein SMKI_05G1170 [Saccharomyces mikatae IFO 1815]CAI4038506.1 hypothetical protein SMKI_05G1170 [Saccharomyces mikatae IFO 1815]